MLIGGFRLSAARLGRWPRRLAAIGCLAMALLSLVPTARATHRPPAARVTLPDGLRALSVAIVGSDPAGYLRVGMHVDLLTAPTDGSAGGTMALVAHDLPVLKVIGAGSVAAGGSSGSVVVEVDRTTALRIAQSSSTGFYAASDEPP